MKMIKKIFLVSFSLFIVFAAICLYGVTSVDIAVDREGTLLKGKFYLSDGAGAFPTVLLLQGFPGNETDVLGLGNRLAEMGINALTFNYSGTHHSQGEWSFANTLKDIQAVLYYIHQSNTISKFKIDTKHLCLGGWSYGGGMALTYAASHPEITAVFSIAGTDHGEFMREYLRNPEMRIAIDEMFASLAVPTGPVKFAKGAMPKEMAEWGMDKADPNLDLKRIAPLLAKKDILLIGGWDDDMNKIEQNALPLYRALKREKAENVKIIAFQDEHSFDNSRPELAQVIGDWLKDLGDGA